MVHPAPETQIIAHFLSTRLLVVILLGFLC
jgi:hypothetical protein